MTVHEFKSAAEFDTAISKHKVVIVDCTASWCGPCKMMSPVFDKLSEDESNNDVYFAKFDVDDVPELAAKLSVRAMPTFKAYKDGEPADEMMGANPPALTALVTKIKA
ncbi:thioredoxin [Zalerion maritima]|uniref:Thioredoxin n=1 Tax=Zalerion maritima TaxID=339359 RepID=A0AAD5RUH3_9PEZI|nr:thioredoxin [Zalerion maritima]